MYLNEICIRQNWSKGKHVIKEGTIVLLRDDNPPNLEWAVGRVIKIHPRKDDITRIVTVKTKKKGIRSIREKISPATN